MYLQLVAGGYVPAMNEVNLRDFAEELVAGQPGLADLGLRADALLGASPIQYCLEYVVQRVVRIFF